MQKLIGYSSSLRWYAKLGVGITRLVVVVSLSQSDKKQLEFVIRAQKRRCCQFLAVNSKKLWIFTFKVSME